MRRVSRACQPCSVGARMKMPPDIQPQMPLAALVRAANSPRRRRCIWIALIALVTISLVSACRSGTPTSDSSPTPALVAECPTPIPGAAAAPKKLPALSSDVTGRFTEDCVRSFVGKGFVAPDLSPRYTLNAFGLSVDPPSRDFRIFYEPRSTKDPSVLLQLFAHRADQAGDVSKLTTPAGNVIYVGMVMMDTRAAGVAAAGTTSRSCSTQRLSTTTLCPKWPMLYSQPQIRNHSSDAAARSASRALISSENSIHEYAAKTSTLTPAT